MFEGNLEEGELEMSGRFPRWSIEILPAAQIVENIWEEFDEALANPVGKYYNLRI